MKVSYNKLWKILIDKKMNKGVLRKMTKMGPNTMAKLGRDETISISARSRSGSWYDHRWIWHKRFPCKKGAITTAYIG